MKEKLTPELYAAYVRILQEELVPAMGCTEPIALAYAAALARRELGSMPQMVTVAVSANIIKNVKSVVVPHTGGLRGIEAAVAAGTVAGAADRELEVLADITARDLPDIADWRSRTPITVTTADAGRQGTIVPRFGRIQPCHHTYQDRHRQAQCLLWCGGGRCGGWRRGVLSAWRSL